jgi:hypothetical protein
MKLNSKVKEKMERWTTEPDENGNCIELGYRSKSDSTPEVKDTQYNAGISLPITPIGGSKVLEEIKKKLREEVTQVLSGYPYRDYHAEYLVPPERFKEIQDGTQDWIDVCTEAILSMFLPYLTAGSRRKK